MDYILHCHDIVKTDFVRGENCYLYDSQRKRYVDLESGIWCTALGHCHPRLTQVIQAQSAQLINLGTRYPHALAERTARDLLAISGVARGKCVFLSSGSEAVEFAVQVARRSSGKPLCLTFTHSYLAAFGSAGQRRADEWQLFDWSGCTHTGPCACVDALPFERIGAFVFEPGGSGSGWVRFPPIHIVREIADRVRQAGGVVVANEITTGMGRTGTWFGFEHYKLRPDIIAVGKGLGNGYPVSAVVMGQSIAEAVEASGFHYAQSHQNDPLGCAVAQEVIALMRDEQWIERGNATGAFFLEGLQRLAEKHPAVVKEVRGRGMLLALELRPDAGLSVMSAYHALLEQGFLVGYYPDGHVLRFDPALTIDRRDIRAFLDCLDALLETAR